MIDSIYTDRAWEFLTFQYDFVPYALGVSVLVGIVCGLVGTFLVLRGFSLVGDATGHATLPGVAGAFLLLFWLDGHGLAPGADYQHSMVLLVGALVSGALGALTVGVFSQGPRVRRDAAIGIVLSVFFGIGIVLLTYIQGLETGRQAGLENFLFGRAAGVTPGEFWILVGAAVVLCTAVVVCFRPLAILTFDEGYARALGIPTRALEIGLLFAVALAVVLSIQSVGVILVAAMLIIPPSAGRFLSGRLVGVVGWSVGLGAISGFVGALVSYVFEGVATGPAMVLAATFFFLVALCFGPYNGLLWSWIRGRSNSKEGRP